MSSNLYFTPGPSALYFTVEDHIRSALKAQIPSISHRSEAFSGIYRELEDTLRELVGLPPDFHVFLVASATEVWERILQSCVSQKSLHLVNGAFSKRFYNIAGQLGYQASAVEAEMGSVVTPDRLDGNLRPDLVAITHNETSTGAQQPLTHIEQIRSLYPEALIAVDVVSSFPLVDLPYNSIDTAYFSVQKCMGLPAGLGVWLINDRCIQRAYDLIGSHKSSYHGVTALWEKHQIYQTPETPNVLNIYLLSKVLGDMRSKGIDVIRREGKYKSTLLYHVLENAQGLAAFVKEPDYRSETVIVISCTGTQRLKSTLDQAGLRLGSGYGPYKQDHLRIANFPTHSKEQIELLADKIESFSS